MNTVGIFGPLGGLGLEIGPLRACLIVFNAFSVTCFKKKLYVSLIGLIISGFVTSSLKCGLNITKGKRIEIRNTHGRRLSRTKTNGQYSTKGLAIFLP